MRRLRHGLIVAVLACTPGAAYAGGQDFTLVNRTGYQIDKVYVSPTNARQWGGDAMVQDKLDNGQRVSITLPRCQPACQWDLRVEYHDGAKATWSGLDLPAIARVALVWNTKSKTTSAQPD